jgi:hypothetical protein
MPLFSALRKALVTGGRLFLLMERHHLILSRMARCFVTREVSKNSRSAEVRSECEADLEEQVVRQYVREGACHIGMMLDLSEAGFDVIGVNDNVVVGV